MNLNLTFQEKEGLFRSAFWLNFKEKLVCKPCWDKCSLMAGNWREFTSGRPLELLHVGISVNAELERTWHLWRDSVLTWWFIFIVIDKIIPLFHYSILSLYCRKDDLASAAISPKRFLEISYGFFRKCVFKRNAYWTILQVSYKQHSLQLFYSKGSCWCRWCIKTW